MNTAMNELHKIKKTNIYIKDKTHLSGVPEIQKDVQSHLPARKEKQDYEKMLL